MQKSLHTDALVDVTAMVDKFAGSGGLLAWHLAAVKRDENDDGARGGISLILIGQLLLGVAPHTIVCAAGILFIYFLGFNVLKASQPWLVSKLALGSRQGALSACTTPRS